MKRSFWAKILILGGAVVIATVLTIYRPSPKGLMSFGVGAFILTAGNLMRTEDLLAGVCLLSLLGLAVGHLVSLAERRLLAWR